MADAATSAGGPQAVAHKAEASEDRFYLAMQGMNDGLWDWNIPENSIYLSERFKQMLGYGPELENRLEAWTALIHPEDADNVWKTVNAYLAGKIPQYKSIFRVLHKDGNWRWLLSRGVALRDDAGGAYRMVGAHTDITEQKELEYALREACEKAESASNAKTEFLANMSHEIRTPMNAIVGLANILATTPLTERQKVFITTLQLSAETLLGLINDMLDITKIEDSMIEFESIPFSMHELMERVVSMMSVKANEKGLRLEVRADALTHDYFIGDPLRIQQVIVNLVTNAIKFTPHGNVAITVSDKETESEDMRKVTVQVKDTGIGIARDKHYAVFQKFTQGDSSITRKYGGSGLGLTISKELMERMGGSIHLTSEADKGSVFTIHLPLRPAQETAGTAEPALSLTPEAYIANTAARVLLVEDYAANILVATTLLEEFGYSCEVATDGMQALEEVRQRHFNAVLMDVQMHGMDGMEATRRIRAWEKAQGRAPLFIIAMTAHALTGDREKCLAAGMNDYISKPFNSVELRAKLAMVTSRELEPT